MLLLAFLYVGTTPLHHYCSEQRIGRQDFTRLDLVRFHFHVSLSLF